ncbi:MAG: TIGR03546 family protein [Planctomycetota bacterium]
MTSFLLRPVRQLAQALTANDSARQIAWGFVLGMMIGLLPKGNLVLVGLTVLLCALRVNKSAGMLAAGIFSIVGFAFDGLAHRIGSIVLLWEPARPVHVWLYEMPLGPWLGLNNTVVVGQLLLALYFAFPVYFFVFRFANRIQRRLSKWLLRYRVIRWLRGAELGAHLGADV